MPVFGFTQIIFPLVIRILFIIGTRGITADISIMEEAAHAAPNMFREVILPLLGCKNHTMLAIATPDESVTNHYSKLMDTCDEEGKLVFKTIRIALWCKDCLENKGSLKDDACPHRVDLIPPWKSSGRLKLIQKVLAEDPTLFARENMGLMIGDERYYISQTLLKNLTDVPRAVFGEALTHYIFIGIDPSGGGSQSTFAMVSLALLPDSRVAVRAPRLSQTQIHNAHVPHEVLGA